MKEYKWDGPEDPDEEIKELRQIKTTRGID